MPLVDGYDVGEVVRRTPVTHVFLAHHRLTGTSRELIVVDRVPGIDQDALRRAIEAEAAVTRSISHAAIAPVEDVGLTNDGRLFVATTRPVGQPLHALLADDARRLPVVRAFDLGHMVVTAVAAAHERGIAHGWLTPSSVIVVPPQAGWPERVVVLGFGTAVAQDAGLGARALSAEQFPYASPQRGVGEPPTLRDDVFSLGSLLLRLFVGRPPSVVRAVHTEAEPPAADDVRTPGDIEELLDRARAADPGRRYASARELGSALWAVHNAWFASQTADPEADAPVASVAAGRVRRLSLVAAGIVGIVASAGAARIWRARGPVAPTTMPVATTPPAALPQTAPAAQTAPQLALSTPAPVIPDSSLRGYDVAGAPPVAHSDRVESRPRFDVGSTRFTPAPAHDAPRRPPAAAEAPLATLAAAPTTKGTTSAGEVLPPSASDPRVASRDAARVPSPESAPPNLAAADAAGPEVGRGARAGEVLATVAEYGTAVGARDLGRLEHVYPAMTEQQRRGWQAFFGSVSDLHAPFTVEQITVSGATAQVRVRTAYEYENLRPHRAERSVVSYKLTLAHDGSGWTIRAVD